MRKLLIRVDLQRRSQIDEGFYGEKEWLFANPYKT